MEDSRRIVRQGYDQLGSAYRTHYEAANPQRYQDWLAQFVQPLPVGSRVLELGCADGIPVAQYLSRYVQYVGIDLSPVMIALARQHVPDAQFAVADMTTLSYPDASFDGIIALYSIIHVPLPEQPALVRAMYRWLKPNGHVLCVVGTGAWSGTEADWIAPGTVMYWSHADAATYRAWFTQTGFTVLSSEFVAEGQAGHTLFRLQK